MPLYAYKCNNCDHRFEIRQRYADDPLTVCPQCEGTVRRVISQVGIVFKGSGFYVTDNRNGKSAVMTNGDGKAKAGKESSKEESASEKKSETKQKDQSVAKKSGTDSAAAQSAA